MKKNGEIAFDTLIPWIIMLGVLILSFTLYFTLGNKGNTALDFFKNLWRFGK